MKHLYRPNPTCGPRVCNPPGLRVVNSVLIQPKGIWDSGTRTLSQRIPAHRFVLPTHTSASRLRLTEVKAQYTAGQSDLSGLVSRSVQGLPEPCTVPRPQPLREGGGAHTWG